MAENGFRDISQSILIDSDEYWEFIEDYEYLKELEKAYHKDMVWFVIFGTFLGVGLTIMFITFFFNLW